MFSISGYVNIDSYKKQVLSAILSNEEIIQALHYNYADDPDVDPSEPLDLIGKCVFKTRKNPDTIETTQPYIMLATNIVSNLSVKTRFKSKATIIIDILVHKDDINMSDGMLRADFLADKIVEEVSKINGTWLGAIQDYSDRENYVGVSHNLRELVFTINDVNIGAFNE